MSVSDFIKMLCNHNRITVAELARRIGQSSQNLTQKIKRGTVSMDEMAAIGAAVNADYNQSFVMPNRDIISLNSLASGEKIAVDESSIGRNLDISLIPTIFSSLFYLDLDSDKGTVIYQSKWVEEKNKQHFSASQAIREWINNAVLEGDRQKLLDAMNAETIKEKIKVCAKYSVYYRSTEIQDKGYHEVLIVRARENDFSHVYVCHINRENDFGMYEQQSLYKKDIDFSSSSLWSAISEVYDKCYICNLSANEFRRIQTENLCESNVVYDGRFDELIEIIVGLVREDNEKKYVNNLLCRESLLKIHEAGQSKTFCECTVVNEDESESRKEIRVLLTTDMFANVIAVILISDITERYIKDQRILELSREDQNYIDILDTFTDKFLSAYKVNMDNDTYEIIKYNPKIKPMSEFFELNERSWTKNASLYIKNFVCAEDQDVVSVTADLNSLRNALEKRGEIYNIYREVTDGRPEYCEMHAVSHKSKWGGNFAIISFCNVDGKVREQMENQDEMRKMLHEANAAIEAKKKFLFNMSHDIRTPMNAILGFAQIAMMNSSATPKLKECLEKILQSGDSLLQIINDVLEMSNLESGSVGIEEQIIHSETVGKSIISMIQQAAFKKNIRFSYLVSNVVDEEIYCDVNHVNQILINLLTNAINFTPEGGRVIYSIEQIESQHLGEVSFCFEVTDNGVGISEEFVDHIFEPFAKERTSTESGVNGTGLGLTIAHRLADLMGGRIQIIRLAEGGTSFKFYVNFRKIRSNIQKKEFDSSIVSLDGLRVLVADDDRLNREVTKKMLGVIGIQSDEVTDGRQLMDKLLSEPKNTYSVILMDVQMPEMDGFEATTAIRTLDDSILSNIPIIAMTANEKSSDMQKCFAIGMNDFITKPINIKTLESVIEHAMNSNV